MGIFKTGISTCLQANIKQAVLNSEDHQARGITAACFHQ
jgi:hypothetical protein